MTASRSTNGISRRDLLRLTAAGFGGFSTSGWLERMAGAAATHPQRKRACILLWMNGGPSQMDTFDLKPGHENGGPFREITTSAPGVRFSEHLPRIAPHADRMAIIRSMSTKEGDHARGTRLMHTRAPGPRCCGGGRTGPGPAAPAPPWAAGRPPTTGPSA